MTDTRTPPTEAKPEPLLVRVDLKDGTALLLNLHEVAALSVVEPTGASAKQNAEADEHLRRHVAL